MFRDITPEMAGLVSNCVVSYAVCIYVLIKRRDDRSSSTTWILSGASTVQFILATIHAAVTLRLLIEGFIHTENIPNGAFLYWINPASKSQVIAKTVYITNTIFADCMLIWRAYMIWGKNIYVCILPILITCASTVTAYMNIAQLARISGNLQPDSLFEILRFIIATWCLSMATQFISTGLIAGKIWWHAKLNPVAKSRYMSIILVVIESGAILTITTAFLLATADLKTQAGAILGTMATQIATIVPTLIIVRVELIRSKTLVTWRNGDSTGRKQVLLTPPAGYGSGHKQEESSVQVTVSTLSASDSQKELKYAV